jgi:hypothetical protein
MFSIFNRRADNGFCRFQSTYKLDYNLNFRVFQNIVNVSGEHLARDTDRPLAIEIKVRYASKFHGDPKPALNHIGVFPKHLHDSAADSSPTYKPDADFPHKTPLKK